MYEILCTRCEQDVYFEISEIMELDDFIDRKKKESYDDGYDEGKCDAPDLDDIMGVYTLADIVKAVKNDSKDEALFLLDKFASELGGNIYNRSQEALFAK